MFKYRQEFKDKEMDYKLIPSGLTRNGFQSLLKQKISKENLKEFFNKKINENNISSYTKLLEKEFYIQDEPDENESGYKSGIQKRKYLLDLIIIAIYEEVVSINEVIAMLESKTTDELIIIFEQIAFLELGLFSLDLDNIINIPNHQYHKKIYLTDNIQKLIFGEKCRSSYQSIENIYSEISSIYNDSKDILQELDIAYLDNLNFFDNTLYPSIDTENPITSLTKINRFPANVEKNNIGVYSFLFNYITSVDNEGTIYDETLLRKFYAISINGDSDSTRGTYKEIIDGNVFIRQFNELNGIAYYDTLLTIFSNEAQLKRINEFLHKFWNFISERTINY